MIDPPSIPNSLWTLMAQIGPIWAHDVPRHVGLMVEAFSQLHQLSPKEGVEVWQGISFGPDPKQRFDLFLPKAAPFRPRKPVLIFVHGGAFVSGDRNLTSEIYANVGYYFARHGIPVLNADYRLAPDAKFPAASEDVGSVVEWANDHAADYGWDPQSIFLMGHSAGAAHAASYAYDERLCSPADGSRLAGLIVVSGRVRADNSPMNPNSRFVAEYYGSDADLLDDRSPVSHAQKHSVPTLLAWSEYENPLLDVYCGELAYRLGIAKGRMPPVVWLPKHNHTSTIAHLNTAEDILGAAVISFIDSNC